MLRRLLGLRRADDLDRQRQALYGLVVAQARRPELYSRLGVPDTFDGRLEMMILHLYAIHKRLLREGEEDRRLSQGVFDTFFDDMDAALREAAVGDQAVPKRLQKITRVFYGHAKALDVITTLPKPERTAATIAFLESNIVDADQTIDREGLAHYVLTCVDRVDATALEAIKGAKFSFPDPV
ncbi:MAG: ubiquinol-cytochrome C chaperone family protein [Pseudomonadota bacterium]